MIDPQDQWCVQIDVTNICNRDCSNCTRLKGHGKPFLMGSPQFAQAVEAVKGFPLHKDGFRLVGIIGGEPLVHPQLDTLLDIMAQAIPDCAHRGLWTGGDWRRHRLARRIEETFTPQGIHHNDHSKPCYHTPILVAVADMIPDASERQRLIDACWLQQRWASTITPKGYFFCEVAGAFDWVFDGPGGLPIEPECWKRPLADFREQIERWCPRCGVPLNLRGRLDKQGIDDISPMNLRELHHSPRVRARSYVLHEQLPNEQVERPWEYRP